MSEFRTEKILRELMNEAVASPKPVPECVQDVLRGFVPRAQSCEMNSAVCTQQLLYTCASCGLDVCHECAWGTKCADGLKHMIYEIGEVL